MSDAQANGDGSDLEDEELEDEELDDDVVAVGEVAVGEVAVGEVAVVDEVALADDDDSAELDDLEDDDDDEDDDEVDGNRAAGGLSVGVLDYLARSIVDDPDAVDIEVEEGRRSVMLRLHVAPSDMGRVIGRRGRVAQAIRTVVRAAGARDEVDTSVDIVD